MISYTPSVEHVKKIRRRFHITCFLNSVYSALAFVKILLLIMCSRVTKTTDSPTGGQLSTDPQIIKCVD